MSNMDTQDYLREIERDAKRKADIAQREREQAAELDKFVDYCIGKSAWLYYEGHTPTHLCFHFILYHKWSKMFEVKINSSLHQKLSAYYITQAVQS